MGYSSVDSTPSCFSAASSMDNLAGPLNKLDATRGAAGVPNRAWGPDRKEGHAGYEHQSVPEEAGPGVPETHLRERADMGHEELKEIGINTYGHRQADQGG